MFAGILLPNFRLQAARRWRDLGGAIGLVGGTVPNKTFLLEINPAARKRGIFEGMTPAQAMARDAKIHLLSPAPAQEECLHQLLRETAQSLSSEVEQSDPGLAIADLRRSARGLCWHQLAERIIDQLQNHALEARVGIAPTPDLASLAAESARPTAVVYDGRAFVTGLSIEALNPGGPVRQILRDWGIASVGDFLKLPPSQLTERLGPEARILLDRVSTRHLRPLRLVRTEPIYAEAFDFEYEIETTEPLLFLLRRFLETLCERLRTVFRVADQLILHLPLEDQSSHERRFVIPAPTAEVAVLYRVLETHLETLQLVQHPIGVRLTLHATTPPKDQFRLFENTLRDPNRFGETLARLKAFLGNESVGIPQSENTHQPDRFQLRSVFETPPEYTISSPARGLPLRRYRPAMDARVRLEKGSPAALEASGIAGSIRASAGPFRLSGDWWDRQRWETEEWDIELAEGGIYRLSFSRHQWRVEGCYEVCGTPRA